MREQLEKVVAVYVELLNERDPVRRQALASFALADDVRVLAAHRPEEPALDRESFLADCAVVQGWRPAGARLGRRGNVDGHHGWIRFAWEVSTPKGEVIEVGGGRVEGVDVVELADDGRFRTVIVFQGVVPALSATAGSAAGHQRQKEES